jgi:hypothetical protein
MSSSSAALSTRKAPARSPRRRVPAGFTDTFTSRYIHTGELRPRAVIGGEGPPLLQVCVWPKRAVG